MSDICRKTRASPWPQTEKSFLRATASAKGWQATQRKMASAFFKSAVHHAPISSKSTLTRYLIQPICFYKSHGEQLEEGMTRGDQHRSAPGWQGTGWGLHLVVLDEQLLPSHSITGEGWGLKKPPLLALSSQHPICIQSVKGPAHKMSDPVLTSSTARGQESERQSLCSTTQQPARLQDRTVSEPGTPAGQRQCQSAFLTREQTPNTALGRPDPRGHDTLSSLSYGRPNGPSTWQILEAPPLSHLQNALDKRGQHRRSQKPPRPALVTPPMQHFASPSSET